MTKNFLTEITDPTGRTATTLEYNRLGGSSRYINDAGNIANGVLLANLLLTDKVTSIIDASGRKIRFLYDRAGYLRWVIDGEGTESAKTFTYEYADTDNNLLTAKPLVAVTARAGTPPGSATTTRSTTLMLPIAGEGQDVHRQDRRRHWLCLCRERQDSDQVDTTVTDAESNPTRTLDDFARPVSLTNAKDETTTPGTPTTTSAT